MREGQQCTTTWGVVALHRTDAAIDRQGVAGDVAGLIVRLGPDEGDEALKEPQVKEFDITCKPMKGWVLVEPEGIESDDLWPAGFSGR